MYQLEIREPDRAPRIVSITSGVDLGRSDDAGLPLADPSVSRRHAWLNPTEHGLGVGDLESTFGTFVNNARLDQPVYLQTGDVIVVGETSLRLLAPSAAPAVPPEVPPAQVAPVAVSAETRPPGTPMGAPASSPEAAAARPRLAELESMTVEGVATIRFRRGTPGERAAKGVATQAKRARKGLEGLGSEPWQVIPEICLVDPFPDPDGPGQMISSGTIVDAGRNEIWMVVTPESPPEAPERPMALLFGASLPAADELGPVLEGYGLWLAKSDPVDDQLAEIDLPPLAVAEGELRAAMGLSFVRFLIDREREEGLRRLLGTAQAHSVDAAMQNVYGLTATSLEIAWRERLDSGPPKAKAGQFLRLSLRYLRPHKWKQAEIFIYMLLALAFTTVFPFATRALFDTALPSGEFSQVLALLAALAVAFVISLLAGLRQAYLSAWVSGAVVRDVRGNMFGNLQNLSTGWFKRHQQGDVLTRLFNDVLILEQGLTSTLRDGIFQLLSLIVSAVVMLTISWQMGIIVLFGAPLVGFVYRSMGKGAQKRSLAVQEDTGALMTVAAENYSAEPVVKLFALQLHEKARFGRLSERLFRSERRLTLFGGLFGLSVNMIVTALRLGILGFGAWLILQGSFTLGGMVAFLGIMGEVLSPVTVLTGIGQQIQVATGALHRIDEIIEEEPEIAEAPDANPLPRLGHSIELRGVDFSYNSERQVLSEVTALIPAGQKIAFVGPSGSGKSTVFQLLMRLYDPDGGQILWDGIDLRAATVDSLRRQLGVVFQDNFLFDTTVRENIALGSPDDVSQEQIEVAAKAAEVHDFILELPRGYDTVVGERGGLLSGGQRQRVAIARALIRNPQVLLLDEATSALDPRTERQITATLDRIAETRTTIAITHRLTSVVNYDRLFVIVDGAIREDGTHDELVASGGVYARLWSEQTGATLAEPEPVDPVVALGHVSLFADLTPDDLVAAARRLHAEELAPGQTIDDGDGRLCLISRGQARVLGATFDGGTAVIAELGEGDVFGVAGLLNGGPSGVQLQATEATTLLVLDDTAIAGLAATHPSVAARLEGSLTPGAAPKGGQRLTRMTVALRAARPPGAAGPADDAASAFARGRDPGALTTGLYPGVGQ
jgi:ABC-type multidrug transport system fused ATPase/permease subunit/pSer/pThr/pTyr-binding forkhead associated (FHA) protein